VVVAPLRLARGVQNKVLEAMAMARPVVAAATCVDAIDARPGHDILAATDAAEHAERIAELLSDRQRATAVGQAGRACVLARYSWPARLAELDLEIARALAPGATPALEVAHA
jgi:glycosyltransferase involved in cell wall biosynthesis